MRCLIALVLLLSPLAFAQEYTANQDDTLKGIKQFCVIIEDFDPDIAKQLNITQDDALTIVELRLREIGLPVVKAGVNIPYLYVNFNIIKVPDILYAGNISIELRQVVRLANGYICMASTWNTGGITTAGRNVFDWRKPLLRNVDKFANAYLAANPKKQ
jgi:hypothetical protein